MGGSITDKSACASIDVEGNLYVLDSEDEDCDIEVAEEGDLVSTEVPTNRNRASCYYVLVEGHPMADADESAIKKVLPPMEADVDGAAGLPLERALLVVGGGKSLITIVQTGVVQHCLLCCTCAN